MAAHGTSTQSTDPPVAARAAPAAPEPMQRSTTDLAVRASVGRTQRPSPVSLDGVRAAASVLGWVLWLLMALITAAFLTFAPRLF